MTVYADLNYYEGTYLDDGTSTIPDKAFPVYARKASVIINRYTLGNIDVDNIPEAVRLCCCELTELLYKSDQTQASKGVASEKVGDISVSYESAESQRQALPNQIRSVVYSWLADTGLLFTGGALC